MYRYRQNAARVILFTLVGLSLLSLAAATSNTVEATALNQLATITPTATPRPPCPPGTIDVNGNGRDDGGDDCQRLDTVARPNNCLPSPAPGELPSQEGQVECILPLSIGATPLSIGNSVGCLDILRAPYPRTMVRLQEPTRFNIVGFIPPDRLGYGQGEAGSYRIGPLPWTTVGLFLHERWGWQTYDSNGLPAFNTEALRPASDPYWYPSINNIRAYLLFGMNPNPNEVLWTVDSLPSFEYRGGFAGNPAEVRFIHSSFPLPAQEDLYSNYGPSRTGANSLPAYKMRVRTGWLLFLVTEWDNYGVNGSNQYVFVNHEGYSVLVGYPYLSYRVWDGRQPSANTGQAFCNAADGYLPVPVIEAQAVIRR
jgi:hypothetical protein